MKQFIDYGITIKPGATGEVKTVCPQCSHNRKKSGYPCLNVNIDKGVWHCWHCEWSGTLTGGVWKQPTKAKPVYSRPTIKTSKISPAWVAWLKKRGIGDQTIADNKIISTSVYMPQVEKEVDAICFPFFKGGETINCKYRDRDKNFRLASGAERILFGLDHIEDDCLIWVEGEIDKLSLYEAGFKSCVSVPDGAPSPDTKNYGSKFDYLSSAGERLLSVKKHIIAVDNDKPGKFLQDELVRRLGIENCFLAHWPEGCKDANEALVSHGRESVRRSIEAARPVPLDGYFSIYDSFDAVVNLYENGSVGGLDTNWNNLNEIYTVRTGDFTVVTGIPSHGKSEWLDALLIQLAKKHGFKAAICSPENQPREMHIKKLAEKWAGHPFFEMYNDRLTMEELVQTMGELEQFIHLILPETPTIDCILNIARAAVLRDGINGLIIDPWNELEHSRPASMTETEYISDSLRKMRQFARNNNIHLWVVAHPTKMMKKHGSQQYEVPTPYDIAGSANWRNKADNCITVYRNSDSVDVHIQKVRVKEVGRIGTASFKYKLSTGEYLPIGESK